MSDESERWGDPASTSDGQRAVFLSYASEDVEAAARICSALRSAGIEVWFDQNELRGGAAWDAAIRRQIRTCALFVPIISANSRARVEGYFRLEWKLAVDRSHLMAAEKTFLLPVVIDGTDEADARVPDKFHEVQWTWLKGGESPPDFVAQVSGLLRQGEHAAAAAGGHGSTARPRRPAGPAAGPAPGTVAEKSIAVLPFLDLSQHRDQEYFSDGLTEELIGVLTRVPQLRVPARTSCFYFKGKQATIADIAQALNVAHVLEGSVRKSGNAVRITVQLIRAETGFHLWSQSFDRTLDDIFKVQDEIAASVVRSLSVALLGGVPQSRSAAVSPEAYQLYLRGHFHWNRRSPEEFRRAISFFQQAIELDPGYPLAFTGLADCYSLLPVYDRLSQATVTMPQAKAAVLKALALDDGSAEAHASLGLILGIFEFDWQAAEHHLRRAIELDPNSPVPHQRYGELLVNLGRFEEGLAEGRRAVELDPLSQVANLALGIQLNSARRHDEAIAQLHKTLTLGGNFADTHHFLFEAHANRGSYAEAVAAYASQSLLDGDPPTQVDAFKDAFARDSWHGFLQSRIRALQAREPADADELAALCARAGDLEGAFGWLEKSYANRSAKLTHLKVDARYDDLRADPRFAAMLRRVGLAS
ncbi:MAG TPA: TIR domain-containing protein [Steroidobacteraceae bacterium]|nr:TIR domain-containing protein [Steroidobacteraceae bacterium]